ncbi:MAG: ABC transporter substrate-binding protein [Anaerolineae bacterium]|nr:ABC transporter substrate-binding protein [Anaerolineae bacterium]
MGKQPFHKTVHPAIWDLHCDLKRGTITRREFLRYASLLGMSLGAATLAACGSPEQPTIWSGSSAKTDSIKRGGTLKIAMPLEIAIDHPARTASVVQANLIRQVSETLTAISPDNVTRPNLLERWEPSEDLKTWTLYLRPGIKFNNGKLLTADDLLFSIGQWLDPEIGSSMKSLLSYLNGRDDVEKIDDLTVRLHLHKPSISVPYDLAASPAVILPHTFEGDFLANPVGTGAFTLEEYNEGETARFRRRSDYWRLGQDSQPLPYLDELVFLSLDRDTAAINAMLTGEVDTVDVSSLALWQALKDEAGFDIYPISTAAAFILRMRADVPPWDDVRVRNALKLCQDRQKILQMARLGAGDLSIDAHVAPAHPAFCEKPIPEYDPERARRLLAEAGYPNGLQATLTTVSGLEGPDIAQILKETAAPGGFDLNLELVPATVYLERWTTLPLGITSWGHRPLDTMVLRLGYSADSAGTPALWNETHWVDSEFNQLLEQAEATLDIPARRQIMCRLEDIMQERGSIGNSYWLRGWKIVRSGFNNIQAHPDGGDHVYEVWYQGM